MVVLVRAAKSRICDPDGNRFDSLTHGGKMETLKKDFWWVPFLVAMPVAFWLVDALVRAILGG